MSSAFDRAVEWVRQQASAGKGLPSIAKEMPEFRDERFTVNRVVLLEPIMVGYADPKASIQLTDGLFRAVTRVAKMHGFEAVQTSNGIAVRSGDRNVAFVTQEGVFSSDRKLFEDLVEAVRTQPVDAPVKDSWLDSIVQLTSKYGVDLIFMALLFFLLPTTLAAISLAATPSLWFPYPVNVGVAAALLLISVYVFRKYLAENRPKR
ncbi:MAG: hypothetical protein QXO17_07730 [Nitrososphaerota archaeon]